MKKFLHSHPNVVIGTLAVALVVVLTSFYSWAISDVVNQMSRALATPSAQSADDFNLPAASKLDLRGLVSGATPAPAPAPTPAPATIATSTTSFSTSTP